MSSGNGNGNRRRRLPDSTEHLLGELIARQLRIEGEARAIFDSLDSDSKRYLQSRFEIIANSAGKSQQGLIQHRETLKDLLKDLREQSD